MCNKTKTADGPRQSLRERYLGATFRPPPDPALTQSPDKKEVTRRTEICLVCPAFEHGSRKPDYDHWPWDVYCKACRNCKGRAVRISFTMPRSRFDCPRDLWANCDE